jgi:hypothetical protein
MPNKMAAVSDFGRKFNPQSNNQPSRVNFQGLLLNLFMQMNANQVRKSHQVKHN